VHRARGVQACAADAGARIVGDVSLTVRGISTGIAGNASRGLYVC